MRNLNLDQLQTLIAIADLGTFAAAAQALHLAPPTISLHVKELESRMQANLLERGRRQTALTPAGLALVQEGRKLLASSDDLIDLVRSTAAGGDGVVKIGVSVGVGMRRLPLMLDMQRLHAATLDIGIVASPQPAVARVALVPWRNDPMVALIPASWEVPETVTPEWLSTKRWACFAPGTQMYGLVASWFGQAGLNPRPYLTLSYPGALKSLASASQSAAILPLEEVDDQHRTPDISVRPLHPRLMRPMAVAHRSFPAPSEAMAAVLEVLAEFAT
jgi:DNA-binding transcriptional LysR family regulator